MKAVPSTIPSCILRIQHEFEKESAEERKVRIARLNEVKGNFTHAWKGYKDHAWLRDEVMPLLGGSHDPSGGWAATLVDALGSKLLVYLVALIY
jgi:mannosyl-oligosaccharide alpha-1,2-mannosidase